MHRQNTWCEVKMMDDTLRSDLLEWLVTWQRKGFCKTLSFGRKMTNQVDPKTSCLVWGSTSGLPRAGQKEAHKLQQWAIPCIRSQRRKGRRSKLLLHGSCFYSSDPEMRRYPQKYGWQFYRGLISASRIGQPKYVWRGHFIESLEWWGP